MVLTSRKITVTPLISIFEVEPQNLVTKTDNGILKYEPISDPEDSKKSSKSPVSLLYDEMLSLDSFHNSKNEFVASTPMRDLYMDSSKKYINDPVPSRRDLECEVQLPKVNAKKVTAKSKVGLKPTLGKSDNVKSASNDNNKVSVSGWSEKVLVTVKPWSKSKDSKKSLSQNGKSIIDQTRKVSSGSSMNNEIGVSSTAEISSNTTVNRIDNIYAAKKQTFDVHPTQDYGNKTMVSRNEEVTDSIKLASKAKKRKAAEKENADSKKPKPCDLQVVDCCLIHRPRE